MATGPLPVAFPGLAAGRLLLLLALTLVGACAHVEAPLHPPAPAGVFYIAREGETLAHIAAQHQVPVEDLAEINGLEGSTPLREGQIVFVLAPQPGVALGPGPPPEAPVPELPEPDQEPTPEGDRPLIWPLETVVVSSAFGKRWGRLHEGIDLAAPTGTPVRAAGDGSVLYASDVLGGYGKMVVLQHPGDLLTAYAHNSALLVQMGDKVRRGQAIARVGQTGRATAPHLHFEVRRGKVPQNPYRFLPPLPQGK
jgi:murein DD-endopeptidase MepM/ murein hydrolase activator NlpD